MNIDALKQQLMDRFGLDEAAATQAIEMVLGFVKEKLPENLQGTVDAISKGDTPDLGGVVDGLKGFFQ
ncbi:hypothetical protein SAMN02745181_3124 [Rubritalea squalenifaciens DSM 18772]|uniref:DUF2267 domain-containing protein n=2 Tax=Rubritalea TaxID=361050 RepID=A0A1M6PAA4_9BACT|nr:DUF2267 domain-containing protein [Rubritalea squalenifaciens]SHK04876.1 hypothetical protein SAMN02745181_3124 [Rubritalea squalenifaciens DSM 18772]